MRAKHHLVIRWCHWVNFPLLALMGWSGLWIYWANDVYRLGVASSTLFKFLPQGFYRTLALDRESGTSMGLANRVTTVALARPQAARCKAMTR